MKKKYLLLSVLSLIIITGCSMKASIPDLKNKSEDDIKSIMESAGIIYKIEYEESDEIEIGKVIRTEPEIGTKVDNKTEVIIYVSGKVANEKNDNVSIGSRLNWENVSSSKDIWDYYVPEINDSNELWIECYNVVLGAYIEWPYDKITGRVSEYADMSNSTDINFEYAKKNVYAGESQVINILVPMEVFDGRKPTTLYFEFDASINGIQKPIKIDFRIVW